MKNSSKKGFSLVELAVVLVVIGVVVAMSLDVTSTFTMKNNISETQRKFDDIETALVSYLKLHGHLPCPASRSATVSSPNDYGLSSVACDTNSPGNDTVDTANTYAGVRIGTLPFKALNLPETHLYDGWGNRIGYAVVRQLATDDTDYDGFAATVDTNNNSTGIITIQDKGNNQINYASDKVIVAYVLVSFGKDGKGSYSRSGNLTACDTGVHLDKQNCDYSNATFRDTSINDGDVDASYFDDVVRWKTKDRIDVEAGKLTLTTVTGGGSGDLPTCTAGQTIAYDGADWICKDDSTPIGSIQAFARNTCPSGWVKANGAAISRTTYVDLYTAIGTVFGTGNGTTTFNVPDLRGEFVRGWADDRSVDTSRVFGSYQDGSEIMYNWRRAGGWQYAVSDFGNYSTGLEESRTVSPSPTGNAIDSNSSGHSLTVQVAKPRPRNLAMLYCIKY